MYSYIINYIVGIIRENYLYRTLDKPLMPRTCDVITTVVVVVAVVEAMVVDSEYGCDQWSPTISYVRAVWRVRVHLCRGGERSSVYDVIDDSASCGVLLFVGETVDHRRWRWL